MSRKLVVGFVILIIAAGVMVLLILNSQAVRTEQDAPLPLTQTFTRSPTGFRFNYPENWEFVIPLLGVLVMAPIESLESGQPGPTFTVHRLEPLSVLGSLENALDRYLAGGPLRSTAFWQVKGEISEATFNERPALIVELEGTEIKDAPLLNTRIIITTAQNTFVYLFITTVPKDGPPVYQATLDAILASVVLLE